MSYSGTPTLYGERQIAAAYQSGTRLPVTQIAVGDGAGAAVQPTEGMTALVNEVYRAPITSWGVDPADTRRIVVRATIPATAGPFVVREAGVFDVNGGMIAVTALAATEIVAPGTSNQATSIDLIVALPIGSAGAITVSPTLGERFTIERLLRTPFISINSASVATPPANPAAGDLYILPASPQGAWATAPVGTIAEWNGIFWAFLVPPLKMVAGIMDNPDDGPAEYLKWTGTAWEVFAAPGAIITVNDPNGLSTADELVGTASPGITAYVPGQMFLWRKNGEPNATTTPKGNVNALGDVVFWSKSGGALAANDLPANIDFLTRWDGAKMRVLGTLPSELAALLAGLLVNNTLVASEVQQLALTIVAAAGYGFRNGKVYTTSGPAGVPAGVHAYFKGWGGGAGGGGGSTHGGGGGGSSGGYVEGPFLSTGNEYVTVGQGAPGGAANTNNQAFNGSNGGLTSISTNPPMTALGGIGGGGGSDGVAGAAQLGGTANGGIVNFTGNSSQSGGSTGPTGQGTGGAGGGAPFGSGGTSQTGGTANGGSAPGGGGGGGAGGNPGAPGAPGYAASFW